MFSLFLVFTGLYFHYPIRLRWFSCKYNSLELDIKKVKNLRSPYEISHFFEIFTYIAQTT